jgi:hypothetical protein
VETESSLPHSQVPATCPYPEQNKGTVTITVSGHSMKTYGELEAWLFVFLPSELMGGEWPASRPGRFPLGKESRLSSKLERLGGLIK